MSSTVPLPVNLPATILSGGANSESIVQNDSSVGISGAIDESIITATVNGEEAFRVTKTGNIAIGTTNSTEAKLEINDTSGKTLKLIYDDTNINPQFYSDLYVDNTGQLLVYSTGNDIKINIDNGLDIIGHNGIDNGLKLNGDLVCSTALQLNYNCVDTIGIASPSKTLITDSNNNISGINTLSVNSLDVDNIIIGGIISNFSEGGLVVNTYSNLDMTGRLVAQSVESDIELINFNPISQTTNYSIEIIGYIKPQFSEEYTFYITSNDGDRLWVDNIILHNNWMSSSTDSQSISINLNAETWYPLRIHTYNTTNQYFSIKWESTSQIQDFIPASRMAWDNTENNINTHPVSVADKLYIYNSSSNNLQNILLEENSGNLLIKPSNGILLLENNNISNNSIVNSLQINRKSVLTSENNIGTGIQYNVENNLNENKEICSLQSKYTNVNDSVESSDFVINLISNGVLTQRASLDNLGQFSVTNIIESSDVRIKENFKDSDLKDSFMRIKQIKLKDYNLIDDPEKKVKRGVIAQQLREVMPTAVQLSKKNGFDDFHGISTTEILSHLIATVQYIIKEMDIT